MKPRIYRGALRTFPKEAPSLCGTTFGGSPLIQFDITKGNSRKETMKAGTYSGTSKLGKKLAHNLAAF